MYYNIADLHIQYLAYGPKGRTLTVAGYFE